MGLIITTAQVFSDFVYTEHNVWYEVDKQDTWVTVPQGASSRA